MGRPLRIEYPNALYHVMSRGNEKKSIFSDDHDRKKLLSILEEYHERYSILVHCFVLMNNHYHLLLETPLGNLVKVMHGINCFYTGYFNRRHRRIGHLFQGRYKAILVEKEVYLLQLSRYIHMNPVRAGRVKLPFDYPWSSYPGYVMIGKDVKWVDYSWILAQFNPNNRADARKRYKEYVEESISSHPIDSLTITGGKTILGTEIFVSKVTEVLKDRTLSSEIVDYKRFVQNNAPDEIIRAVANTFEVSEQRIVERGKRLNFPRLVAIFFVHRYSGLSNREIGRLFGGILPSAVNRACGRLANHIEQNPELREKFKSLEKSLK